MTAAGPAGEPGTGTSGSPSAVYPTAAMLGVLTTSSMAVTGIAVLAPEAAPDIGVAPTRIGLFTAVVYLSAMATGAVTGSLIGRHGAVRTIQATMVCVVAGMILFSLASPVAALASAVVFGCAYGPYNPASAHVLWRVASPHWRPLVFSIKQTGVPLGGALAGGLLPVLALALGWRTSAVAVAAVAGVAVLALEPLRARFDAGRVAAPRLGGGALVGPVRLVLGDPVLRRYTLMAFTYAGCQLSVGAFTVVYLTDGLGMDLVAAGGVFAFMQGGGVAGRVLWGAAASRRLGARRVLAGLGLVTAAGVVAVTAISVSWPFPVLAGLMAVLGASTFGWNGVLLSEIASNAPRGREAEATGGMQVIMFAGTAVFPALFGVSIELSGGFEWGFWGLAVLAVAGAGLVTGRRPRARAG